MFLLKVLLLGFEAPFESQLKAASFSDWPVCFTNNSVTVLLKDFHKHCH